MDHMSSCHVIFEFVFIQKYLHIQIIQKNFQISNIITVLHKINLEQNCGHFHPNRISHTI